VSSSTGRGTSPSTDGPSNAFTTVEGEALRAHHSEIAPTHLRSLFAEDPDRVAAMTLQVADLTIDFSRNRATPRTMQLLASLAERVGLREQTHSQFAGERVNVSEGRAALHTALRLPRTTSLVVDGSNVASEVHEVLDAMASFADDVREGRWRGATGSPIRTVVNIGIGGSDLGPRMAVQALDAYAHPDLQQRFVANVDPGALSQVLAEADPASTLFVVVSKTFTTSETLANAAQARAWLVAALGEEAVAAHFVAVSTAADLVSSFGIDRTNMFGFWDWVGGRYSLDSAVGLSLMLAIGPRHFAEMLDGFHAVDTHFAETPYGSNAVAMLGMFSVWYRNYFGAQTKAVLPYSQALGRFPAYLQQLVMESNGKSVTTAGEPVRWQTGGVVWGEPGTDGQHAFFQLLHQGTVLVPCDFIGFARPQPGRDLGVMHALLLANFMAQPAALAFGRRAEDLAAHDVPPALVPHRTMPGNRPSTVILAPQLTPRVLGQLVALYEHTVFTEGVVWRIDSFDQWGVELGKQMASGLVPALADPASYRGDPATQALLSRIDALRTE
jgi:glucose-6-phosphate isomerase